MLKGSDSVQLDTPAQSIVRLAYQSYPSQITFTPGLRATTTSRWTTPTGLFKNVNLRRAVWADLDRAAIIKARGGSLAGEPTTHFIYPGNHGFTQAGGVAGPQVGLEQERRPATCGRRAVHEARRLPERQVHGQPTVQVVGADNGNNPAIIQIVNSDLTQLGFNTHVTQVDQSVMYAKYCGVPKQEIDACPAVGWVRDFADPLTVLYVPFYGPAIVPTNNSNWGQVNDPRSTPRCSRRRWSLPGGTPQAWANVDKMLVNQAVALPEDFDNQPNVEARTSQASTTCGTPGPGTWTSPR